jgi:TPR repeat protein
MKIAIKTILRCVVVIVALAGHSAWADVLEEGLAALERQDFKTALRLLKPLAEQGDAKAQFGMGRFYTASPLGCMVTNDPTEALMWLSRAAEQGHRKALTTLMHMYKYRSCGLRKLGDEDEWEMEAEWLKWARRAAALGVYQARREIWTRLGEDYVETAAKLRAVADQGPAREHLERASQEAANSEKALAELRKAAELGHPEAQYKLGLAYELGRGTTKNRAEAVKWHQAAGEQTQPDAQYRLGRMYDKGRGVEKDKLEAGRWYRLAAAQGQKEAKRRLDGPFSLKGTPELHVVAVRQGEVVEKSPDSQQSARARREQHAQGLVNVSIDRKGVPIILSVIAYEPVKWNIRVEPGVSLEQIIVGGYYEQELVGVPADTKIIQRVFHKDRHLDFLSPAGRKGTDEYRAMMGQLYVLTGLRPVSFHHARVGKSFTMSPTPALPPRYSVDDGVELHVVSVYEGTGDGSDTGPRIQKVCTKGPGRGECKPEEMMYVAGRQEKSEQVVLVDVQIKKRPIVLALSAYDPVKWIVTAGKHAKVRRVVVGGYHRQTVEGLEEVPIEYYVHDLKSSDSFYARRKNDPKVIQKLETLTGLTPSSFQYVYRGYAFSIIEPVPESLQSGKKAAQLHAIGVYQGSYADGVAPGFRHHPQGTVAVTVHKTKRPVILALGAYEPVKWEITQQKGARLERVIVGGKYKQEVTGVDAATPVVYTDVWAYKERSSEFSSLAKKLKALTGLEITTFEGRHSGGTFHVPKKIYDLVDGEGTKVCEAFEENLNSLDERSYPLRCERLINSDFEHLGKPQWVEVTAPDNRLYLDMIAAFLRITPPASMRVSLYRNERPSLRVDKAFIDIDNDGREEAVLRYSQGNCKFKQADFSRLLFVLNKDGDAIDIDASEHLMQNRARGLSGYLPGRWQQAMYDVFSYKNRTYFDRWSDNPEETGLLRVFETRRSRTRELCRYRYQSP